MKGRQKSETFLDEQVYYLVQAPLSQFIEYIGLTPTNHRHRTKTLSILHDLRTLEPILESFDDSEFRSSAAFPYFKIKKISRAWIITIAIAKQIYHYHYPYQFTKYLLQSESQSHRQVQYFIIQAINTYSLEKRFLVHQFISQFNLSNQKVAQIRKYILEAIQELVQSNIIDTQFKIMEL